MSLPPLVQALLQPQAYPHPTSAIELRQTQMSFVFLSGDYAYKIKKPVNLGYLDYTTLDKRLFFCYREVELNRRLCPRIYLEVVPIVYRKGQVAIGAGGRPVEYAVKMRQLPEDRMLERLLARNEVSPAMIEAVAERMARFHEEAETSPELSAFGDLPTIRGNWEENFEQTEKYKGLTIAEGAFQAIKGYVEQYLVAQASLLQGRVAQGRIRDCHGDLHAAHICFADDIYIYDCIEFNDRFRYCDVASEMAFLAMDLDFHHRPDLSSVLMAAYEKLAQDEGLPQLLPFYKGYRAYVRGKVESFKQEDPLIPEEEREQARNRARRYFHLAQGYVRGSLQPLLVITTGLVGTGKTALAQALAQRLEAVVLSSDAIRKGLAQLPATEHRFEDFEGGIYSPPFTLRTYQEMLRQAGGLLAQGRWVILDATFRSKEERLRARELAQRWGADFWVVETTCPEPVVQQRLEQRLREVSTSDARWEIYLAQKSHYERVEEVPASGHLVLDTSPPASEVAQRAVERVLGLIV